MSFRKLRILVLLVVLSVLLASCGAQEEEPKKESASFSSEIYTSHDEEGGYCYTLLSDAEKKAYDKLAEKIYEMDDRITIGLTDGESIERVVTAIYYDYPEYFWFSRGASYESHSLYAIVEPEYSFSQDELEEHQRNVKAYIEKVCGECLSYDDDYDRIKKAYEYVILNTYYESGENDQNILSVMEEGKSVCSGYSKALQLILKELGYDALYVTGSDGGKSTHAWNIVRVGQDWFNIDATWGDPVYRDGDEEMEKYVNYSYLLVSDKELGKGHVRNAIFDYPSCTSDSYDYYVLNDTFMESFDYDMMLEKIKDAIDRGDSSIEFKLGSGSEFKKAKEAADDGSLLRRAMWYQMIRNISLSADCTYSCEEKTRTVSIFFAYN